MTLMPRNMDSYKYSFICISCQFRNVANRKELIACPYYLRLKQVFVGNKVSGSLVNYFEFCTNVTNIGMCCKCFYNLQGQGKGLQKAFCNLISWRIVCFVQSLKQEEGSSELVAYKNQDFALKPVLQPYNMLHVKTLI